MTTVVPAAGRAFTVRTAARHALWLAALFVLLSTAYWVAVYQVAGGPGMPLDDPFIHLQYARSIHEGRPFQYNPGQVSNGTSAPLWTLMLPLAYRATGDWLPAAYALGAVWTIPCVALTYWLTLRWTGRTAWALFAAVLLLLMHPTVLSAYEGMEVPAYVAAFLLGLLLYDLSRTAEPGRDLRWRLAGSAAFAVGCWLRPEFLLMAAIIAGERALTLGRQGSAWHRRWLGEMVLHAVVWLVLLWPYFAFNRWASGSLLPNTFAIKAVARNATGELAGLPSLPYALRNRDAGALLRCLTFCQLLGISAFVGGLLLNNVILAWNLPGTLRQAWRGAFGPAGLLAGISMLAFPLVRGLVDPGAVFQFQYQRYFGQITPLMILLVLAALATRMPLPGRQLVIACAIVSVPLLVYEGLNAAKGVDNINDMQVRIGKYLNQATPADAVIATNDAGAIAFYANRRIVDTVGLCEPKLAEWYLNKGDLEGYLWQVRPDYACLFPDWHGQIARRVDLFEPIEKVRVDRNVICGGTTMWVLRTRWNKDFNPNWLADAEAKAKAEAQAKAARVARRTAAARSGDGAPGGRGTKGFKGQ